MRFNFASIVISVLLVGMIAMIAGGCGQNVADTASGSGSAHVSRSSHDEPAHDHGSWWCAEHGVPEEECSICSPEAVANFKEKGDWCEEHNRAESQCFKCDPSRAQKFAKLYEAKFGHQPPEPTE